MNVFSRVHTSEASLLIDLLCFEASPPLIIIMCSTGSHKFMSLVVLFNESITTVINFGTTTRMAHRAFISCIVSFIRRVRSRYMMKLLFQFNAKISTYIEIHFVFFSWHFLKLSRHLKQFTVVLRYVGQGCENIELV